MVRTMSNNEDKLREIIQEFVDELEALLSTIEPSEQTETGESQPLSEEALKIFFNNVRRSLFNGRLTSKQVSGMETKLKVFKEEGVPLAQAAYLLATSYHETARRMQPVREGLSASDAWRKRNLRYYPWYGRGDVQLTWKYNYEKVDEELGLGGALVEDPDLALDTTISARALVAGVMGGWYNGRGHGLAHYVPSEGLATKEQFKQARRTVNIMDKATMIAGYALKFQTALKNMEY